MEEKNKLFLQGREEFKQRLLRYKRHKLINFFLGSLLFYFPIVISVGFLLWVTARFGK